MTELFEFDKRDLERHIDYEMKLFRKIKEPLTYIMDTLEKTGHSLTVKSLSRVNLNRIKLREGKNYHWGVIIYKNVKLLVRQYGEHLTIFTRIDKYDEIWKRNILCDAAFTFHSDLEKLSSKAQVGKQDELYDNPFADFNKVVKGVIDLLINDRFRNSVSLPRAKHVKFEQAYESRPMGESRIFSFDLMIFCLEEISCLYNELFAENTMLQKLPELKNRIGKEFDYQYNLKEIHTKVKDGYYHDVGLMLVDKEKSKETRFYDVYSLSKWFYKEVFGEVKKDEDEGED
jgi:hypothetical protein